MCLIKHNQKKKAERTFQMVETKKAELVSTLTPLIDKINTIQDVANGLLRSGYEKLEAVNDFLDHLVIA